MKGREEKRREEKIIGNWREKKTRRGEVKTNKMMERSEKKKTR